MRTVGSMASKPWRELDEAAQAELVLAGCEVCPRCQGHGYSTKYSETKRVRCFVCGGCGYVDPASREGWEKNILDFYRNDAERDRLLRTYERAVRHGQVPGVQRKRRVLPRNKVRGKDIPPGPTMPQMRG